jgi:ankyrin repeat protein
MTSGARPFRWWVTATTADVQAELSGVADVMARDKDGWTPLHMAAGLGNAENIQTLLDAGADVMARKKDGCTVLLGPAPLQTSKPYWPLAQTQKRKTKKAKPRGT